MPLEQVSNPVTFYAMYVASKVGKTGLTVTVDVYRVNTSATATQVVTGASATEVGDGLYLYQLTSGTVTVEGEYVALFKTADTTVDVRHIPAIWAVQKAGIESLDATVSSRLPTSSYTAPSSITSLQADVTTILGRVDVAVSTRLGTGGGSTSYAVTVTRPDGTTPISGASVWVTTDSAGGNVIAGTLTTDGSGVATFMLDAGAYYLWRQAEGWNFANPTAITVS